MSSGKMNEYVQTVVAWHFSCIFWHLKFLSHIENRDYLMNNGVECISPSYLAHIHTYLAYKRHYVNFRFTVRMHKELNTSLLPSAGLPARKK